MSYPEGVAHTLWRGNFSLNEFGLGYGTEVPTRLRVPKPLVKAARRILKETPVRRRAALWLRLVPPYGYLGAVPWEDEMIRATGEPLIRVPDRLPVAADPGLVWSAAIVVNAMPGSSWAAPYVSAFLDACRKAGLNDIEAHVFADEATYQSLVYETARIPGALRGLHLHVPGQALEVHQEREAREVHQFRRRRSVRVSSPRRGLVWADWIAAGLGGRAVRALHVVSDAAFDGDLPLLTLSPDPGRPVGRSGCTYVSGDGVRLLAETIGASMLSIGSPPGNPFDVATRVMADTIGLRRAGATLYSSLRLDPNGQALARAYAFITGPRRWTPIPRHPSLFAYLQPEHVEGPVRGDWPNPDELTQGWLTGRRAVLADSDAVTRAMLAQAPEGEEEQEEGWTPHIEAEAVPGWVAASERYIDANVAYLVETAAPPDEVPTTKQSYDLGTAQALGELRDLLARRWRPS